ncbi:MAG: hypothetical protein EBW33_00175 [Actinobacteria bacterium]|nr:hypothetical protein [Actinomycetota bacterium]
MHVEQTRKKLCRQCFCVSNKALAQVQNRYNTFVYEGLPPGPIGSPTRAAIEATLNPADGDWLYFVTVLPNETRFTSSYDEFLRFKAEYKRNYANGAFE